MLLYGSLDFVTLVEKGCPWDAGNIIGYLKTVINVTLFEEPHEQQFGLQTNRPSENGLIGMIIQD